MEDDFTIDGGLEDRAFVLQFFAEVSGVDEISVVPDGDLPPHAIDHERLCIRDVGTARRGVSDVADSASAGHFLEVHIFERLRDETHGNVALELRPSGVRGDNPRALLPAMLESEETVVGHQRGIRVSVNGKDAAFVFWLFRRGIDQGSARQARR